jgi:hypothetical protein
MKILLFISIVILNFGFANGQENIVGKYRDNNGSYIEIKSDSTFIFKWAFSMSGSWSVGKWTAKKSTIYFEINPIFDTLRTYDENNNLKKDTLVFSIDEKAEVINYIHYAMSSISAGGQNRFEMPKKLYFHEEKLFYLNKGRKTLRRELKRSQNNNQEITWFYKY